ncbi:MAG TPA: TonB-dependent receptor [Rhizomicrobium sp.]|jgi:iron complex outermembrane receptor protein|nr:TonB-dependent receptor [Rhizomicrobium sp.]
MIISTRLLAGASLAVLAATPAVAQNMGTGLVPEFVIVSADRAVAGPTAPDIEVAAAKASETINTANTEDMLKYAPSLLVRKRHIGDTQDPVATRTSGVGASARSLIFVDGIMINSPIGNNNGAASPHFGVAAPRDVNRIDVLYGPFAAAYGGGSIGAVINITTRMPDHFELHGHAMGAVQNWRQYGSDDTVGTWQLAAGIGDRIGAFAWRLSANHLDSRSQPLSIVTLARPATAGAAGTPVTGASDGLSRTGTPIAIIGAAGLEHQVQDTDTLKLAYDFDGGARLAYTVSLFHQDDRAQAQAYLRSAAGTPVYSGDLNIDGYNYNVGAGSFSNNVYHWPQTHLAQGLSLKSGDDGDFAWSLVASNYAYLYDSQRVPGTALPGAAAGGAGSINRLTGTGWYTLDASGGWRGFADHDISFGLHRDVESLSQRKFATANWINGGVGALSSSAHGRTATNALWLQDVWTLRPGLKAALGARLEDWRANDGANFSAAPALNAAQPSLSTQAFSPKLSLAWQVSDPWALTASWGGAYRMPTVTELYQVVTTGTFLSVPDPDLKPEHANTFELSAQRRTPDGTVRLSIYQEDIDDALLSQSAPLVAGSTALYSFVQNVDHTRVRGFELYADQNDVMIAGLELTGSLTYADGRITKDTAFARAMNKFIPQLPKWRANAVATYRIGRWAFTLGARYSDRSFGTIDNSDPVSNSWQGFAGYLVVDARAQVKVDDNWTLSAGIDNLNNDKYFLFHPFPQRTLMMEVNYAR